MNREEILALFREKDALLEGHFRLSSGLHSPQYLQCAKMLQYPRLAEELCRALTEKLPLQADLVIAPAVGGIIVGQEVARILGIRAIFAEREEGKMILRRGFQIKKKEKILAVEDVVTTGGSLKEVIALAQKQKGNVLAAGMLIDRSGGKTIFPVRKVSLLTLNIENYPPESCPLCKKGTPFDYPGSRPL